MAGAPLRDAGLAIPRTSQEQWAAGPRVAAGQEQPGDLVFFAGSDGTPQAPGHVGIVIDNGEMIEAYAAGFPVRVSTYGQPFSPAGDQVVVGFSRPVRVGGCAVSGEPASYRWQLPGTKSRWRLRGNMRVSQPTLCRPPSRAGRFGHLQLAIHASAEVVAVIMPCRAGCHIVRVRRRDGVVTCRRAPLTDCGSRGLVIQKGTSEVP